jgi:hypothetical protein
MVVDALDLCYTKPHVDTFVIISGDSDFSPLVAKLRENNKLVIGVGVKNSTSDLLTAACDEFIYYDDLVRAQAQKRKQRAPRPAKAGAAPVAAAAAAPKSGENERKQEAIDLVMETIEALQDERGEQERIWGSQVKQALKRRRPGFRESYHGFRTFARLLEAAAVRGHLKLQRDQRSGDYVIQLVQASRD